ncbi:MAG: hypothetical protein HQK89_00250 [Nitrospirae bacterium]|nr:hypothetical protein [Nitrospirota bacterium]
MKGKAELINYEKYPLEDGIIEIKIYMVTKSKDKPHGFKYSLAYIENGERIIGYDNCEGKGDHFHYAGHEGYYEFIDLDRLKHDFFSAIRRRKDEG